jgi:hypothetical protein
MARGAASDRVQHRNHEISRDSREKAEGDAPGWVQGDFAADIARGRWDIKFFAKRFLGVDTHPGQDRLFDAILMRDQSGWRPRYLDISCSAGNRAGKTLGEAIALFHSTFYKMGQQPPRMSDPRSIRKWMDLDYSWYHFGISQEIAELAYIEIIRLLQGTHEAQKHGCPLTQQLGLGVARWDRKYRGEYLWIQLHPVLGGGEIHFRTTGEKAVGSLGKDMHGISYDEAGFDPNFDFVVNEVLNMRRLSTGGQLWVVGTSTEGLTAFADHWFAGDPDAPDKHPDKISIRMSTRDNIGYGIDKEMFDRLEKSIPPGLVPQNIDGLFLEGRNSFFAQASVDACFIEELPETQPAIIGHRYVQGADPALTYDSTWSIVLDSRRGQAVGVLASRQRGRTTGPVIASLVLNAHRAYDTKDTTCLTGIDSTGFGGAMFRDLLPIPTLRSIEFGGSRGKKLRLLNDLKKALETGTLRFPRSGPWLTLRRQLLGYRLDDKKLETDAVMALAVAIQMLRYVPGMALPGEVIPGFDFFNPPTAGGVPSAPSGPPPTNMFGQAQVAYTSMSDMARIERATRGPRY